MMSRGKVLVAMSGGVDSSMAAKLLLDKGYEVVGCTMRLYITPESEAHFERDTQDAAKIAERLGFKYHVLDLGQEFRNKVIDPFAASYLRGETPNPCVTCNKFMKFGALYRAAGDFGCSYVATGHYARIERTPDGNFQLKKALDLSKDQSYVLYNLTQDMLSHILFPLGSLTKETVRHMAENYGFVNAKKAESQDICFVPDGNYAAFIENYTGKSCPAGDFVTAEGAVLGRHKGILHYTIGQRRGLGISAAHPLYVCRMDPQKNTVTLGSEKDLFSRKASLRSFNWISGIVPDKPVRCRAKVRYRQSEQPATASATGAETVELLFDEPQRAITCGQSAVLYDGDIVLGGGIIC